MQRQAEIKAMISVMVSDQYVEILEYTIDNKVVEIKQGVTLWRRHALSGNSRITIKVRNHAEDNVSRL